MDNLINEVSNKNILLTRKDLADLPITYSNSHLLELERQGKFPKRITLSKHRVAWIRAEIDQWFRQKMDERGEFNHAQK